jgi:hypothetical protein
MFSVLLILEAALSSCGVGFRSSCLDQNFVYSRNHTLEEILTHLLRQNAELSI